MNKKTIPMNKLAHSTRTMLTTKTTRRWIAPILALGLAAWAATPARAATATWTGGGGDNQWTTVTNWSTNPSLPGTADVATFDSANLGIAFSGATTATLDGLAYTSNATGSVNITEAVGNRLSLDGGSANDISVAAGNHTITGNNGDGGDLNFSYNQVWNVATGASLTFTNVHMRANSLGTWGIQGGGLVVFGGNSVGTTNAMDFGASTASVLGNTTLKMTNNLASGAAGNKYLVVSGSTLDLAANFNSVNGILTISGTGVGGVGAINNSSGSNTIADGTASVVLAANSSIGVASGTLTMGQDITETGGARQLTKVGTGNLTLENVNAFTGATLVDAGTLLLSGTGSINTSSGVSVASTATFTNNSSVAFNKALTLAEGAALSGTGAFAQSALTIAANLSDGFTTFALGATSFTESGNIELTLSGITAGSYTIFSGSAFSGAFGSMSIGGVGLGSLGGGDFSGVVGGFTYTFTDVTHTLSVVPEPSTAILLFFGGLAMFALCHRSRLHKA